MKHTQKIFLMLPLVFATSVFCWSVPGVSAQSADNMAALGQSRQPGGVFLLLAQNHTGEDTRYNPAKIYRGPYGTNLLFYKNPKATAWVRGTQGDFTREVACAEALQSLKRTGLWQGHLRNGACGSTDEPVDWAVGNRLNYEGNFDENK